MESCESEAVISSTCGKAVKYEIAKQTAKTFGMKGKLHFSGRGGDRRFRKCCLEVGSAIMVESRMDFGKMAGKTATW